MARWQPVEREARYYKARRAGKVVVVSEGDSWFDYPMYRNIIDYIDDQNRFAIKRLEFSGDTVAHMVGIGDDWSGLDSLLTVVEHERPRFVLFSGGGNDIVGDELKGAFKPFDSTQTPAWHLDTATWRKLTNDVESGYRELIKKIGPLAPVFAHGYDFIIPSNRPVRYDGVRVAGPWVWTYLEECKIPTPMMGQIGRLMIEWFNTLLGTLEKTYPDTFGYIDLRDTLTPQLWQNEIHPTQAGFEAVAKRFQASLNEKLITVLARHDARVLELR
jgi:hypothetical protein